MSSPAAPCEGTDKSAASPSRVTRSAAKSVANPNVAQPPKPANKGIKRQRPKPTDPHGEGECPPKIHKSEDSAAEADYDANRDLNATIIHEPDDQTPNSATTANSPDSPAVSAEVNRSHDNLTLKEDNNTTLSTTLSKLTRAVQKIKAIKDRLSDIDPTLALQIDIASKICQDNTASKAESINKSIQNGLTREEALALCEGNWPKESFTRTTIVLEKRDTVPGSTCAIIARRGNTDNLSGRLLFDSTTSIHKIIKDAPKIVDIRQTETVNGIEECSKTTFLLMLEEEGTILSFLDILEELKDKIKPEDSEITLMTATGKLNDLRKALEITFAKTTNSFKILVKEYPKPSTALRINPRPELLTISPGQLTYADLLKTVKDNIADTDLGVRILRAEKNTQGQLQLKVKGKASSISEILSSRIPGIQTAVKAAKITLHIRDLEEEVSTSEIEEGLKKVLPPLNKEDLIIKSIRPAYNGTCNATIQTSSNLAHILHNRHHVQIGLVSARIRIRSDDQRCARCRGTGHSPRECNKEDMRGKCFKCGLEGHIKSRCPNTAEKTSQC